MTESRPDYPTADWYVPLQRFKNRNATLQNYVISRSISSYISCCHLQPADHYTIRPITYSRDSTQHSTSRKNGCRCYTNLKFIIVFLTVNYWTVSHVFVSSRYLDFRSLILTLILSHVSQMRIPASF